MPELQTAGSGYAAPLRGQGGVEECAEYVSYAAYKDKAQAKTCVAGMRVLCPVMSHDSWARKRLTPPYVFTRTHAKPLAMLGQRLALLG